MHTRTGITMLTPQPSNFHSLNQKPSTVNILTIVFYVLIGAFILNVAVQHGRGWFRERRTGNDGLTDRERTALAKNYLATAGSKVLTPEERRALNLLREKRK